MGVIPVVTYASLILFLVAVIARFVKIQRLPIHLRWELYPVAHEKGRASYGGSYLEESNWWTKKRESSKAGELKVMIPEILLLQGVREHNPKHWFLTFPFHFGLYLLCGLIGLLLFGGIAAEAGMEVSRGAGVIGAAVYHLTYVVGYAGFVLGLLGAFFLLGRRIFNADYREYTAPADYFNLLFFVVTMGVALAAHLTVDNHFEGLRGYFQQLMTFGGSSANVQSTGLMTAEIVLGSLLVAYIPLTHMSHFFTKWFMYHDIRWGDEPNMRGGKIEERLGEVLNYPVSWSAPHIQGDGKKTWADIATSGVEEKSE